MDGWARVSWVPVSQSGLIDLGEAWTDTVRDDPPRRTRRWRWPLVVALAVTLVPAGSAAPRRDLVDVLSVPLGGAGTFAVSDDGLYVSTGTQLTGYRLDDRGARWRITTPFRPQGLLVAGTVLLAQTSADTDGQPRTLAVDTRTGGVLWTDQTLVDRVLPGPGLAVMYGVSARGPVGLHTVRLRTGRTVWQGPDMIGTRTVFDLDGAGDGAGLVTFWVPDGPAGNGAGTVQVMTEATGRVVASGPLPPLADGDRAGSGQVPAPAGSWLTVAFGRLLVARYTGYGTEFTAYRLDTLAEDWHTTVSSTVYTAADCDSVLCLYGRDELDGLDPASGATRWSSREWTRAYPLPGDRLLLSGTARSTARRVVDAVTLRPLADLTPWTPLGGQAGPAPVLSWDSAAHETWFAVLPDGPGQPRTVGSATGVNPQLCLAVAHHIACPTLRSELRVWRYGG
jgi:hypothetical protein